MKKYEILEHKADLKIRAFGKDKKELFRNALFGTAECLRVNRKPQTVNRKIVIKSADLPALLVDFLSEALYLSQVNREVYFDARFSKFSNTELSGELIGRKVERFGEDIKGVTYHDLATHQKKDGTWQATILFDI